MVKTNICPLCGSEGCSFSETESFEYLVSCRTYNTDLLLSCEFVEDYYGKPEFSKSMDLIVEKIVRQRKTPKGNKWKFYYSPITESTNINSESINLAPLLLNYPSGFMEIANRALLNLSYENSEYGHPVHLSYELNRLLFTNPDNTAGMVLVLEDLGYLRKKGSGWIISAEGWKYIEKMRKAYADANQGFIAMSFNPKAASIRKCFKEGIKAAGFVPMIIDEKEHNHQIVPELLKEIEKSKFLVLDITYPNYGAYYEAGYALALGKEVIICCDNKVFVNDGFERPHFDIAQMSQIRWDTEEELVERLTKRIRATVVK